MFHPNCDSIIFDLDGTLWDASRSTAEGWARTADMLGLEAKLDASAIRSVSGLPFDRCVEALFGKCSSLPRDLNELLDKAEKEEVLKKGGELYPEVRDGLAILKQHYRIFLVSNCQEWYMNAFLEHSGLKSYFDDALCFGQTSLPKKENIRKILQKNKSFRSVYVGDTHWDQQAAFYAGTRFIFAAYGFGTVNTKRCPTVHSFSELTQLMISDQEDPNIEIRRLNSSDLKTAQDFYNSVEYAQPLHPSSKFYGAFDGQNLIGLVRLGFEESFWVLRGMQIHPKYQFLGIGTQLIRLLETDLGAEVCFCLPHGWLENFYGQIGFKIVVDNNHVPAFLWQRLTENQKKYPELILMKR